MPTITIHRKGTATSRTHASPESVSEDRKYLRFTLLLHLAFLPLLAWLLYLLHSIH